MPDFPPAEVMADLLLLDNATDGGIAHDGQLAVQTPAGPP